MRVSGAVPERGRLVWAHSTGAHSKASSMRRMESPARLNERGAAAFAPLTGRGRGLLLNLVARRIVVNLVRSERKQP
ncbi:MAG: hypothetical protein BroJett014_06220 [Planctomycetota bacterium]|nr:MAG: hypothetical protein BroJett014_06220 [Planctomycetota bacterium]